MQRVGLGFNDFCFLSRALRRDAVVQGRAKKRSPNPQETP